MDELMSTNACTLPTADRPFRLAEFDALFAESVRRVEWEGNTVRMHLTGPTDLGNRVRDLAERETACCSFFTFGVDGNADDLTLRISVPPEHHHILAALAARASKLTTP